MWRPKFPSWLVRGPSQVQPPAGPALLAECPLQGATASRCLSTWPTWPKERGARAPLPEASAASRLLVLIALLNGTGAPSSLASLSAESGTVQEIRLQRIPAASCPCRMGDVRGELALRAGLHGERVFALEKLREPGSATVIEAQQAPEAGARPMTDLAPPVTWGLRPPQDRQDVTFATLGP